MGARTWIGWITVGLLVAIPTLACGEDKPKAAWDGEPLAGDPQEILKQVQALAPPMDEEADVLLMEHRVRLETDGRRTITRRVVFRPLSRSVAESWGHVQCPWAPWYQLRPSILARVITPDGKAHMLDPKSIAESPLGSDDRRIYSDRRLLRAPLPAIQVGAVVEEVFEMRDERPFFPAGTVTEVEVTLSTPVRAWRLVIEHPADFPAVISVQGIELKESREQAGNLVRRVYAAENLPADKDAVQYLPPEVIRKPRVLISGRSTWSEVAKAYAAIVDGQIGGAEVAARVKSLLDGGETRQEAAAKLVAGLRRDVRYTSLAFGESAIVPATCQQTLSRRYGDCKDQSALLAAMLRAAGHEAYVALVHIGDASDVPAEHPALNHFNHAIVYVPGEPPLWIDPTVSHCRVGTIPVQEQGKLVLVCAAPTTELVRIPRAPSSANRTAERIEIILGDGEPGRGVRTWEYTGEEELRLRAAYAKVPRAQIEKQWGEYVEKSYDGAKLQQLQLSDLENLSQPQRVSVQFGPVSSFQLSDDEWVLPILPLSVLQDTPFLIYNDSTSLRRALGERLDKKVAKKLAVDDARTHDVVLPMPYVYELEHRIALPPGFVARQLPGSDEVQLGPARMSWSARQEEGTVVVTVLYDTGPGRFTPADIEASREAFKSLDLTRGGTKWPLVVHLEHEGVALARSGKWPQSLAAYERRAQTGSVAARCRYVRAILSAGFGELARREARALVEAHPQSALAHSQLANILAASEIGQLYRPGCDLPGALAAARQAAALAPDDAAY